MRQFRPGRKEQRARNDRLAQVAAAVGARFVQERIAGSAMDWLRSPKKMFGGRIPIEACQEREGFLRAMLLHKFGLGGDVEPGLIDSLPRDDCCPIGEWRRDRVLDEDMADEGGPALFTYSIVTESEAAQVQIFGAMTARTSVEVRNRLRERFGPRFGDEGVVRLGFDWSEPLACALVSDAMGDLLLLVEEAPNSTLAQGLDFQVEQRFLSEAVEDEAFPERCRS